MANSTASARHHAAIRSEFTKIVTAICCLQVVHGPDPENLDIGTIRGGNFYHTFLERRHPGLLKKSSWTCQRGSLIGENALPWQPGVKFWRMHLMI